MLLKLKEQTHLNSVVQTELFTLFDYSVFLIDFLKLKEQTYINSVVQTKLYSLFVCRFYLIVLLKLKEQTYINSVVKTKLYSLFDVQGLFNKNIYKQCCSNKTVFIV